jgi:hypothetical protein
MRSYIAYYLFGILIRYIIGMKRKPTNQSEDGKMAKHRAINSPYIRCAIEIICSSGTQSEDRLKYLVEHYCGLYGVDPTPYVIDALDYFRTPEYQWLHGDN